MRVGQHLHAYPQRALQERAVGAGAAALPGLTHLTGAGGPKRRIVGLEDEPDEPPAHRHRHLSKWLRRPGLRVTDGICGCVDQTASDGMCGAPMTSLSRITIHSIMPRLSQLVTFVPARLGMYIRPVLLPCGLVRSPCPQGSRG